MAYQTNQRRVPHRVSAALAQTHAPQPTGRKRRTTRQIGRLLLQLFRIGCWTAGIFGVICGLYLTLKPSSMLSEVPWLPGGIARWADSYGRFRNFPAYATLALPFMLVCNGRRARARAIRWLALFGAAVEAAQYFLPTRWCEWQDVAWSWAGLATTWIATELGFKIAWQIRCALKRPPAGDRVPPTAGRRLASVPERRGS